MDQLTLVNEAVEDGRTLLSWLADHGFPVTAAGWLERETDGQPYLYVATSSADLAGTLEGYRKVSAAYDALRPKWLRPNEIKVIRDDHPLAAGLRERADPRSVLNSWVGPSSRGVLIGGIPIVGAALVYPFASAPTPA